MRQWATRKKCMFVYLRLDNFLPRIIIQGGSDISGTLSKIHCHIKKLFKKKILLPQTHSAVCRSINKNKKTLQQR
jgi:hypothetical protein